MINEECITKTGYLAGFRHIWSLKKQRPARNQKGVTTTHDTFKMYLTMRASQVEPASMASEGTLTDHAFYQAAPDEMMKESPRKKVSDEARELSPRKHVDSAASHVLHQRETDAPACQISAAQHPAVTCMLKKSPCTVCESISSFEHVNLWATTSLHAKHLHAVPPCRAPPCYHGESSKTAMLLLLLLL
jgi:hypothetical protein